MSLPPGHYLCYLCHAALALEDCPQLNRQGRTRDIAVNDRASAQLNADMSNDITVHGAVYYCDADINAGIDDGQLRNNECSFFRADFAGDVTVDSNHILEINLAIKFRSGNGRSVARSLFDAQRSTISVQLARE